jgi:hypothetical protein
MKQIIGKKSAWVAGVAFLFFLVSSFTSNRGGEGFEVFVGSKLVLQQFGRQMNAVNTMHLDKRFSNEKLVVKYYHCGRVGKERTISIRDARGNMLREWKYPDQHTASFAAGEGAMSVAVNEVLHTKANGGGALGLYYASSEIPNGRLLVNIVVD